MTEEHWTENAEIVELFRKRMEGAGVSRRDFLAMLAAAAGGMVATACGTQENKPTTGTTPQAVQTAAATQVPPTPTTAAEELAADQTLRTYTTSDPISFDFSKSSLSGGSTSVFAGLMRFNQNFEVEPWLAERSTLTPDGTVYTFYLRKDAKWTNGDPVTAQDFLWSWTRSLDPATGNPYPSYLFDIKNAQDFNSKKVPASSLGMKVIDDKTFEVTLEGPRPYFPMMVAYTNALPGHRPSVEKYGPDKWTEPDKIVSNGYMRLTSWEHNKQYVLERDDTFWGPKPKLQKVVVSIIGMESGLLPYENNEIDIRAVPAQEMKRVAADPKLSKELYIYPVEGTWYMIPEVDWPPFNDLKARQALSHSIDRETISKTITNELWKPAYCYVTPGIAGHIDTPEKRERQKYDPKLAMELLKGTPYEGGKNWPKTVLTMANREPNISAPVVQAMQAMVKDAIGLQVEINIQESKVFYAEIYKHENQLSMTSGIADYPDPNNRYAVAFYSRMSQRRWQWSNDKFDDLIEQGAAELDQTKRLQIYNQAEKIMDDDAAAIWLFFQYSAVLYKPWVKGMKKDKAGDWKPSGNIYRDGYLDLYITKH